MTTKTFTVIGNCQAPCMAHALLSNPTFREQYEWHRIPPVHNLNLEQISNQFEKLKEFDLIIYQPVINAARFGEFEIEHLRKELAGTCDLLCIPSCYFNGYFPTISTIQGIHTPAHLVSDMAVFHAFDLGISAQDAAQMIYEAPYLPAQFYVSAWKQGISELRDREVLYSVDVSLADFLEAEGRNKVLMHQFNHPTRAVFDYLANEICARLGVAGHSATAHDLDPICFPVLPAVKKALGLPQSGSDVLSVNGKTLELNTFVQGSYAAYENMPAEQRKHCAQRLPVLRGHIVEYIANHIAFTTSTPP